MWIIFGIHHPESIASKGMHNFFLPHFSCYATYREYISNWIGTLFSSAWVAYRRIPVFLELSSTDWCVCDVPSWLNMRSPTRSHFPMSMVCRSLTACQLKWCLEFLTASTKISLVPAVTWKIVLQLLCSESFSHIQIKVKILNRMFTNSSDVWKYVTSAKLTNSKVKQ